MLEHFQMFIEGLLNFHGVFILAESHLDIGEEGHPGEFVDVGFYFTEFRNMLTHVLKVVQHVDHLKSALRIVLEDFLSQCSHLSQAYALFGLQIVYLLLQEVDQVNMCFFISLNLFSESLNFLQTTCFVVL